MSRSRRAAASQDSQDSQYTHLIRESIAEPPPPVNARFFYTSPIPIDDPLSARPPPSGSTSATTSKQPPRPFSPSDNTALDRAWHELRRKIARARTSPSLAARERERRRPGSGSQAPSTPPARTIPHPHPRSSLGHVGGAPTHGLDASERRSAPSHAVAAPRNAVDLPGGGGGGGGGGDHATTGTPFVRAPSRKTPADPSPLQKLDDRPATPTPRLRRHDTYQWEDSAHLAEQSPAPDTRPRDDDDDDDDRPQANVAVGISRLHQVEMPRLQMTPIYWAPVHDTAEVIRATWFYQDTMLPVEGPVANMLEAGYVDLQCWTETWKDELNSAVQVGAAGEMKIVHKLWPDKPPMKLPVTRPASIGSSQDRSLLATATSVRASAHPPATAEQQRTQAVQAACDVVDRSTGPHGADNRAHGNTTYGRAGAIRSYATCGVIYSDAHEATILKPNLLPSSYYGRRPLANYIRKGHAIGVPVVRGFDQAVWDRRHPPPKGAKMSKAKTGAAASEAAADSRSARPKLNPDIAASDRPHVTELVLVIHGIGQKLSERMESFHFTHAINDFRREVMVECGNRDVKTHFRPDMGGIMTLPINWRHGLSFEEGGYRPEEHTAHAPVDPAVNEFTLKDITPDTLPSVRGIVSDVMLDIPYYMSHHQPTMIAAVIREANRVYTLWCRNNPGFAQHGRVHIIAHSLGSVMAIDILSQQPTIVPPHLSHPSSPLHADAEEPDHFLFNTHNLFLAGSPAGFFLLLRRSQLRPRIDHPSAQALADPASNTARVCGPRGQYGCLAVDNLYNIINGYDPVAYHMNAAVDAVYAASLRTAHVPSNTPGYWFPPGTSPASRWFGAGAAAAPCPPPPSAPSPAPHPPVELDVHDFPRHDTAATRMRRLNDNGQIDYLVRYGGGPFDIPYLTMLGAHSAYWGLRDFIRMVVVELGRAGGPEGTWPGLRAVKKRLPRTGGAARDW